MKTISCLLLASILLLVSCKKDDDNPSPDDYPKEVTFTYAGKTVTFQVIRKDYLKDANGQPLASPVSRLWLDRNLGAERAAVSPDDTLALGDLFQWGRLADGHQARTSLTTETASPTIVPGHDRFIVNTPNSDWLTVHHDSLWNAPDNANCPCPAGWRVPTVNELGMEMYSWDSLTLESAFNSPLKWAAGGDRDATGHIYYTTYWAFIWSSTPKPDGEAGSMAIIGNTTATIAGSPRNFGMSVRCIRDL